ncbi:MAG: hypothetical protein QG625_2586 [Cyanobacteriota bacterium erpe_2018_sw_39hr_WHONDRS-SW48-000098_B_bin.30]|nr:hypothetical protein [Cyanobacteriota bacterium erpe_2018_sw_39hr_WHONDRS-SW48-000098_B_bin.30]
MAQLEAVRDGSNVAAGQVGAVNDTDTVNRLLDYAIKVRPPVSDKRLSPSSGGDFDTKVLFDRPDRAVPLEKADTFSLKLSREKELFMSLPSRSVEAMQERIANHKTELAVEAGIGVAVGIGLAAVTKNPAIVGKTLAPYARQSVGYLGRAMVAVASVDWSLRLGVPAVNTWIGSGTVEENKKKLGQNVGNGVLDYGAGLAGGLAGVGIGSKLTTPWVNRPPAFDPRPSLSVKASASEIKTPEAFRTVKENKVNDDVVSLYEKSFPKEERQPVEEIRALVESGVIQVHTTRTASGELKSFSFTSMHKESAKPFANLDFIATAEAERSTGIGSLHARRLSKMVKEDNPDLVALTLEMEHPAESGLELADKLTRARRAMFYDRLDAPDTKVKYNILDFEDPAYRGPAQWRAWIYKPQEFNSVETARGMYTNEGGYGLSVRSKPVREFERVNNYYEPSQSLLSLGLSSTAAQNGSQGWRFLQGDSQKK